MEYWMKALKERMTRYHMYASGVVFRILNKCLFINVFLRLPCVIGMADIYFVSQRVACLLRKVVQEIERRISTQAEHLRTVRIILPFSKNKKIELFLHD